MAKSGDTRVKNAAEESAPNEGYERASDLYAPDDTEGLSDLSPKAKVTLRNYLKQTLMGHGPAASPSSQAKNAYLPPEEGSTNNEGSFTQNIDEEVDSTRLSAKNGKETWRVGHGTGGRKVRSPFGAILTALAHKYPLGKYVPPLTKEDKEQRPGTLENAVVKLAGSDEKHTTIGGANPHRNVKKTPADFVPTIDMPFDSAVSHALSYNRFNPTGESPLVVDGKKTGLGWSLQRGNLGFYDPRDASPSNDVLSQLGRNLIALQTGHDADRPMPTTDATIIPTFTQLGLGNSFDLTRLYGLDPLDKRSNYTHLKDVDDGIGTLRTERGPSGTPLSGPGPRLSYGALNSHLEPFEGSFGIFVVVAIQLIALIALGLVLNLLFGDIFRTDVRSDWRQGLRGSEMAMGQFRSRLMPEESDYSGGSAAVFQFIKDTFDFPNEIVYTFGQAFMAGLEGFLGFDLDNFDPVDAFMNVYKSSGFLAIVVRFVLYDMMDWQELADTWSGPGSRFVVDALFKTFDIMAGSHTIKFALTMAKSGDATLTIDDGLVRNSAKGYAAGLPISNSKFLGAAAAGGLMIGSLKLQGMSNTYGQASLGGYLSPSGKKDVLKVALDNVVTGDTDIFRLDTEGTPFISRDERISYEKALDATYCPFYFHDLRTNEIISFHAFLANLTDSYAANYTDVTGIGRIESAKIYTSTNRSIGLTFKVFAVTADDMDAMWIKINRLVAMVYPQYTAGRAVSVGGKVLRAPFSQQPVATPMIRLRVGDVIGSNASEMGLSRLYGMTNESNDGDGEPEVSFSASDIESGQAPIQAMPPNKFILRGHERLYYCNELGYPTGMTLSELVNLVNKERGGDPIELPMIVEDSGVFKTDGGLEIVLVDFDSAKSGVQNIVVGKGPVLAALNTPGSSNIDSNFLKRGTYGQGVVAKKGVGGLAKKPRETDSLLPFPPIDIKLGVPANDISPGPGEFTANVMPGESKAPHPVTALDFKNPGNAPSLLKSFRERGGKGLPGVITAIDLGNFVSDDTTWGADQGYRAPKFLEVTIQFSPVHDLPPGLDSAGQMTSALYGVGGSRAFNKGDL